MQKTVSALFVLALLSRIVSLFLFPTVGTDHTMMHAAADNLLNGHGLSLPAANPEDFTQTGFRFMNEWPPLTAYCLAVLKAVTQSARAADLIMMTTGMVLLFTVIHALSRLLNMGLKMRGVLWIILGTNGLLFAHVGITDLWATVFYVWSALFCIRLLREPASGYTQMLFVSLVFFLPAAFRYQYYPLVFVFPILLLAAGKISGNKMQIRQGLIGFSAVFFLLSLQVALLVSAAGEATYVPDDVRGFYPQNLLHFSPFLIRGLADYSYIYNRMMQVQQSLPRLFEQTLIVINIVLVILVTLWVARNMKTALRRKTEAVLQLAFTRTALLIAVLAVPALLAMMSLRYHTQDGFFGSFTYVKEARYFLPSMLLGMLLLLHLSESVRMRVYLLLPVKKIALPAVLLMNTLLFANLLYSAASGKLRNKGADYLADVKSAETMLGQIRNDRQPLVVVYSNKFMAYELSSGNGVVPMKNLNPAAETQISRPVQLLLVTHPRLTQEDQQWISRYGAKEIFTGKTGRAFYATPAPDATMLMAQLQ